MTKSFATVAELTRVFLDAVMKGGGGSTDTLDAVLGATAEFTLERSGAAGLLIKNTLFRTSMARSPAPRIRSR